MRFFLPIFLGVLAGCSGEVSSREYESSSLSDLLATEVVKERGVDEYLLEVWTIDLDRDELGRQLYPLSITNDEHPRGEDWYIFSLIEKRLPNKKRPDCPKGLEVTFKFKRSDIVQLQVYHSNEELFVDYITLTGMKRNMPHERPVSYFGEVNIRKSASLLKKITQYQKLPHNPNRLFLYSSLSPDFLGYSEREYVYSILCVSRPTIR